MKTAMILESVIAGALLGLPVLTAADAAASTNRLKRSEAFLGIHFDFHAGPDCTEIGKHTSREMVEAIVDAVKPDFIQTDCKGHAGFSSYPTKVGNPAPGFVGDPLKIWRDVTAERGVSLYMHYSGIWDSEAVRQHPEWAAVNPDGKPDKNAASPFGPYADQLLIPQLRELAGVYGVDGVWVDGECWATIPDYGEAAVKAFRAATGIQDIPKKAGDPHWAEWQDFHREAFRQYLRHYVNALKASNPNFEVASNWAFSDHMPEPVTADVAFLSGDFSPQNSLNSARFSARCLQGQGKPWDLMSWSFTGPQGEPARSTKSVAQLSQEAAVVLAQGGGYQAYFTQNRDGSVNLWQMKLMGEVAKFCRARQAVCHRAEAVPQVALLYSKAAHYRSSPRLFAPWGSHGIQALRGVLQALLDGQNAVEIVSEHHLAGRMSRWPLIVIPEWDYLEPAFRDELVDYVKGGGSLLLVGPASAGLFATELDLRPAGEAGVKRRFLEYDGWLGGMNARCQTFQAGAAAKPFGLLYDRNDLASRSEPAAYVRALGAGHIATTTFDFADRYLNARTPVARDFLNALVRELFPNPLVTVTGSHSVDVSVMRNHGRLLVNLVNTAGPHEFEKAHVFDDIPPAGPLQVTVRAAQKPKAVVLEPGRRLQRFGYRDGLVRLTVPAVEIHDVVVIEE